MSIYNWKDYLENYEICYSCILSGITTFPDFLHPENQMDEGPISSDQKCGHCWITEKEFGRIKVSREKRRNAGNLYELIEKDRKQFLKENF